nr:uncharacterized protein LOC104651282 [Saimiri boliviensis boliviensis]
MCQCAEAHAETGAAALEPKESEQSWLGNCDTQLKLGLHRLPPLWGSHGPGQAWEEAEQPEARAGVAGREQENVYLEGVRTSAGVWLFMARKLTGKGLLARLSCCATFPRQRRAQGTRGCSGAGEGALPRGSEDSTLGSGLADRPAQEPAGKCSGLSRYSAATKHLL